MVIFYCFLIQNNSETIEILVIALKTYHIYIGGLLLAKWDYQ